MKRCNKNLNKLIDLFFQKSAVYLLINGDRFQLIGSKGTSSSLFFKDGVSARVMKRFLNYLVNQNTNPHINRPTIIPITQGKLIKKFNCQVSFRLKKNDYIPSNGTRTDFVAPSSLKLSSSLTRTKMCSFNER